MFQFSDFNKNLKLRLNGPIEGNNYKYTSKSTEDLNNILKNFGLTIPDADDASI